ncbi:hypothetical protein MASR1M32_10400 [Rhodobacter sp.]
MTWLLIITLSTPGQPAQMLPIGIMADPEICGFTGAAVAEALERTEPGLEARWTCLPEAGEAA